MKDGKEVVVNERRSLDLQNSFFLVASAAAAK